MTQNRWEVLIFGTIVAIPWIVMTVISWREMRRDH